MQKVNRKGNNCIARFSDHEIPMTVVRFDVLVRNPYVGHDG